MSDEQPNNDLTLDPETIERFRKAIRPVLESVKESQTILKEPLQRFQKDLAEITEAGAQLKQIFWPISSVSPWPESTQLLVEQQVVDYIKETWVHCHQTLNDQGIATLIAQEAFLARELDEVEIEYQQELMNEEIEKAGVSQFFLIKTVYNIRRNVILRFLRTHFLNLPQPQLESQELKQLERRGSILDEAKRELKGYRTEEYLNAALTIINSHSDIKSIKDFCSKMDESEEIKGNYSGYGDAAIRSLRRAFADENGKAPWSGYHSFKEIILKYAKTKVK